uniref:Uncharacterized protein n=1 Tax=Ralstonia solanacearum TaxID=305 RepID=A0A0S4WK80_RALSL|nr:protein of unknown function [Ralstonia solanacearum]
MELVHRLPVVGQQHDQAAVPDRVGAQVDRQLRDAHARHGNLPQQEEIIGDERRHVLDVHSGPLRAGQPPAGPLPAHTAEADTRDAPQRFRRVERAVPGHEGWARRQHQIARDKGPHHQVGIIQRRAHAQRDVIPLADHVDAPVGHVQLQPHLRLRQQKLRQHRCQEGMRHAHRAADAQPPRRPLAGMLGHLQGGACGLRHHLALRVERRAHVGDVHRPGRALQQPHPQPLLQVRHAAAHARLGNPERPRGGGKTAVRHHGGKQDEVVEVFHDNAPGQWRIGCAHCLTDGTEYANLHHYWNLMRRTIFAPTHLFPERHHASASPRLQHPGRRVRLAHPDRRHRRRTAPRQPRRHRHPP